MNEKIKGLLEQAKKQVEHGEGCYPATTVRYDALEKFAELIVRRVISVYNDTDTFKTSAYDDRRVLEYFGIEK